MPATSGEMLLTIFLKHRQNMNLGEINQKLDRFWQDLRAHAQGGA
jgi:hypothetical protein